MGRVSSFLSLAEIVLFSPVCCLPQSCFLPGLIPQETCQWLRYWWWPRMTFVVIRNTNPDICLFNHRGWRKKKLPWFFFFSSKKAIFSSKACLFWEQSTGNSPFVYRELLIPKEAPVCQHVEGVFRAFTSPISLRTHLGSCSMPRLSGHFGVPAKPYSIAKKMCHVFEDDRIAFP